MLDNKATNEYCPDVASAVRTFLPVQVMAIISLIQVKVSPAQLHTQFP